MTSRTLFAATLLAGLTLATGSFAATKANPTAAQAVTKACAAQYKTDKAANKVPAGEKWSKYLSDCSKSSAAGTANAAPVATPAPAPMAAAAEASHPAGTHRQSCQGQHQGQNPGANRRATAHYRLRRPMENRQGRRQNRQPNLAAVLVGLQYPHEKRPKSRHLLKGR